MFPFRNLTAYILVLAAAFAVWFGAASSGLLSGTFLPRPNDVLIAALAVDPPFLLQCGATASLVVAGFVIGLCGAWLLSLLTLVSPRFSSISSPLADLLRGIPPVCFIPFFILWFGFEPTGKIVLIAINVILIVYPTVVALFRGLDSQYLHVWLSAGRGYTSFVLQNVVQATSKALLPTLRFTLAFSVMLAIISEVMGATLGLGHIISVALNTFSLASVMAASLGAALLSGILDVALMLFVRQLVPSLAVSGDLESASRSGVLAP